MSAWWIAVWLVQAAALIFLALAWRESRVIDREIELLKASVDRLAAAAVVSAEPTEETE